jgi:5S rRNA maturation endonuclease (ribonuclease M5)
MKKKNVVYLILMLLLSTGVVHAKITNKAFLMEIFDGCIAEGKDYDNLVKIIGVGSTFEYCGCATNELSKNMNIKDLMKVGVEIIVDGGDNIEGEMTDKQLAIALKNKNFSNAIVDCMSKLM